MYTCLNIANKINKTTNIVIFNVMFICTYVVNTNYYEYKLITI